MLDNLSPHQPLPPDEKFRSEDGVVKPFRMFDPGEWMFHTHGGTEEKMPSAKTFPGGFHCFACNETYALPRTCPWEPEFPFTAEETIEEQDASAFLPKIDWEERTKRNGVLCPLRWVLGRHNN